MRAGKGGKDRFTVLPAKIIESLKEQIAAAQKMHELNLKRGLGVVEMPFALARKYPNAEKD